MPSVVYLGMVMLLDMTTAINQAYTAASDYAFAEDELGTLLHLTRSFNHAERRAAKRIAFLARFAAFTAPLWTFVLLKWRVYVRGRNLPHMLDRLNRALMASIDSEDTSHISKAERRRLLSSQLQTMHKIWEQSSIAHDLD